MGRTGWRRSALATVALAAMVALGACTSVEPPVEPTETPSPTRTASASPSPSPASVDTSSIRSIIDSAPETPELTVAGPAAAIAGEDAQQVSYVSGGLTVTGVVRMPAGDGPFPAVAVVHGAVDPDTYESGGDLLPEQRALLAAGYAVFALDLRGYAESDPAADDGALAFDPGFGWSTVLDWGMALDVVNGLALLRSGAVDGVDTTRIGLLGHSMGGLLALDAAVIAPGASDLVVALSPPASDFGELIADIDVEEVDGLGEWLGEVGTPAENPDYWADISPRTFIDRATEPLLLIHGGADSTTLPQWSRDTSEAWRAAGLESEAIIIGGADHLLRPHRGEADRIIVEAFDTILEDGT